MRETFRGAQAGEKRRNGSFEGEQREREKKKLGSADRMISLPTSYDKKVRRTMYLPCTCQCRAGCREHTLVPRYPNLIVKLEARLVLLQLISSLAVPKEA